MDTLITSNNLATPRDIASGMTIYIPNMRGIIYQKKNSESLAEISRKFKGSPKILKSVNKMDNDVKPVIFIPCGKLSSLERSLFLGTAFASPVNKGRKTSGFGVRRDPIQHDKRFHSGIDIACPIGTRISAARNGKVIFSGYSGGYGKLVIIKHSRNYCTYYGHLNKILVKKGDTVATGQKIAISGNTGRTTGPHLHFEVRKYEKPIDPGLLLNR
ncbi:MAG: M23 family metallopeptidase [Bacteroidota bacterium]